MAMKVYSSNIQHHWNLTIRLFSVITRTLDAEMQSVYSTTPADWAIFGWVGGGLTPMQRSSRCVLQHTLFSRSLTLGCYPLFSGFYSLLFHQLRYFGSVFKCLSHSSEVSFDIHHWSTHKEQILKLSPLFWEINIFVSLEWFFYIELLLKNKNKTFRSSPINDSLFSLSLVDIKEV